MPIDTISTDRLVTCPCCGEPMHFERTVPKVGDLPDAWLCAISRGPKEKWRDALPPLQEFHVGEWFLLRDFRQYSARQPYRVSEKPGSEGLAWLAENKRSQTSIRTDGVEHD